VRASKTVITLWVLAIVALRSAEALASIVTWKAAGNGNWSDGKKWSTDPDPPKMGDDVVISVDGTYTVTMDVNANLNSLTLGGGTGAQTLTVGNQILTLSGPNASTVAATGVLNLGSLSGAGNLTVNGMLNWTNGTIAGAGMWGARCALNATGPAPGPPPPCGVVKVLCRFMWTTSNPRSPGRVSPSSALRFAPSM